MKTRVFFLPLVALIAFSVLPTNLSAQDVKTSSVFVPQVGQQGKDVVWVPTPQELVNKMLEIAEVTPQDFVIDLGSGDGRTVITAAKIGAKAMGVEYNPDMVALSKENARKEGVGDKAEFIQADLYETDLSKATVITMFLLPEINLKLRPKLLELEPGTRIVSNTFTMGDWQSDKEVTTDENWNSWNTAHLWIVPAKVEGNWKLGDGELNITQEYQFLKGSLISGGKSYPISDGKLSGRTIYFTADGTRYNGEVNGKVMKGVCVNASRGEKKDWMATR
jgi:precorrin-6B methylase 2